MSLDINSLLDSIFSRMALSFFFYTFCIKNRKHMSLLVLDWSSKTLKPVWISEGISQMENRKIVFFDGVCNLCTGSVQWILKRNKKKDLYFSQIGGDTYNLIQKDIPEKFPTIDSILYYNGDVILVESVGYSYSFKIFRLSIFSSYLLSCYPKFIRDFSIDTSQT